MREFFKILALLSLIAVIALGANGGCECPGLGLGIPGSGSGSNTSDLGEITGYVSSSALENSRIPGATITVTGGGKTYTTVTDGVGNYTIFVPPGTYTVSASKETFNTETEDDVTVTADGTTTLNFALTTGSGETVDPNVEGVGLLVITRPSQVDVRSIVERITSKSDIKDLIKSLPVVKDTEGDYKTLLVMLAGFTSTPPVGTQGTRVYIRTSSSGPFILLSEDGGIVTSMPPALATNSVDNLQPDTTYYLYPSLYGTWGEVVPEECIPFKTPKELGLIQPENNYTVQLPVTEPIHVEWDSLDNQEEDWEYDIDVTDMEGTTTFGIYGITDSYYDLTPEEIGEPEPGEYLWRVTGDYSESTSLGEIPVDIGYLSVSYPRRAIVEYSE